MGVFIQTANEAAGEVHVVVVEEEDFTYELRHLRNLVDALDEALSCAVGGVCLTSEDELDGIVGVVDYL